MSQEVIEQDFLEDASRNCLPIRLLAFESGKLTGTIIEIDSIFPFAIKSILAYRPEILAGGQAETYQIALEVKLGKYKKKSSSTFSGRKITVNGD